MPEGPEARVFSDELNNLLNNKIISTIEYTPRAKIYGINEIKLPTQIEKIYSYGKKVIFKFIDFYLICSLGMTGKWVLKKDKHSYIKFSYKDIENKIKKIYFSDLRSFGDLTFYSPENFKNKISTLGPCLTTNLPDKVEWLEIFSKRSRKNICAFLMDQNIIAGIGNYLKADILFVSKISPDRKVGSLSEEEILTLRINTKKLITESYQAQGNTIQSYQSMSGKKGQYQTKIYGKKEVQGYLVKIKKTPDQRKTHYIPELQL